MRCCVPPVFENNSIKMYLLKKYRKNVGLFRRRENFNGSRLFLSIWESSIFKGEFLNGPLCIFWVLSAHFSNVLHLYRRATFELLRTPPKTGQTQKRTFYLFTKAIFLFTEKNRPLFSTRRSKNNNLFLFPLFNHKFDRTSRRKI